MSQNELDDIDLSFVTGGNKVQDDLNDWHNWVSNDHSISRKDGLCALKRIIQNHLDINVYSETERIQAVALLADIDAALAML